MTTRHSAMLAGLVALAAPLLLSACASKSPSSLQDSLENRGPIALSDQNPYLAGNVLLSERAGRSEVLTGFLKFRGAPPAIEVERDFMAAARLKLYYPDAGEVYTVDQAGDDVVINGPQRISGQAQAALLELTRSNGKPPMLLGGAETPEPPAVQPPEAKPTPQPPAKVHKAPAKPHKPPQVKRAPPKQAGWQPRGEAKPESAAAFEAAEENLVRDLQQTQEQQPAAELTPDGDVVHYVTYPGETLSMISRWYTHDRANVGRLVRMNQLKNPDALKLGDVIVIPRYLLKNKTRMSEEAIRQLTVKR